MAQLSAVREVNAKLWLAESDGADDYWVEGELGRVQAERTDNDEIRVGLHLGTQTHESAGAYLNRSEAIRLMLALASAIGDR